MEEVKLAAGYIRVSTAEQSTKGLSIETQIAEIEAYAKIHNMRLEGVYIDRGITARKSLEKRIEFMRMMRDVASGRINHIIVLRLDRFFRNVYDYHRMMNEYLEPNKCDWSAVKEQYTTTTTNGRLMINLRLAIAEQECDTDSDRIKDVLDHRAKQGFAISGSLPYGLKIVDHRVVPDEETKDVVQEMFVQMIALCSVRRTMFIINEKFGTKFSYGTVRRMLSNPLYCGRYRDMEEYCKPTVSKKQFDKVQDLIKMNVKARGNNRVYAFSGLMVCAHCGKKLTGKSSKTPYGDYYYYRCNLAWMDGKCTNIKAISKRKVEEYFLEHVERLMEDAIIKAEVAEKEKKAPKSNRKAIEKKLLRLNDLYVDGFIDKDKYKADYAALQAQIVDVAPLETKKDLAALKAFLQGDFKSVYGTMTELEKQSMWRSVVKEIRVSGTEIKDIIFL